MIVPFDVHADEYIISPLVGNNVRLLISYYSFILIDNILSVFVYCSDFKIISIQLLGERSL